MIRDTGDTNLTFENIEESKARWICCPMCDKKKCERNADDCDVKKFLEIKESEDKE